MSIRFEWYENPDSDKRGEKRYHARPVLNGRVETDELAHAIQDRCSLTEIDANAVLDAVSRVVGEHLRDGQRVHLNGLGYFQISLTCDGEDILEDTKRRNTKVHIKGVNFVPDQKLRRQLGPVKFDRIKVAHSVRVSDEEVDARVNAYLQSHDHLTRSVLQELCGIKSRTAIRQLTRLQAEGKIKNIGWKRQPVYVKCEEKRED
ncbi:DNA-binding protein [Bacteroidaceae bacterium HV4-6-C5C]|nr:DNA-binding protein [Bacteroidaceae bacterium HV4-6-C5C]